LLNKRNSLHIINSGLDRINISIEGVSDIQYKTFSDVNLSFQKLVENIHDKF
jgi:hypothetical protein